MTLAPFGDDNGGHGLNSEINVTPFVDVTLVLLIIFMVAAPMLTVGVPVNLPRAALAELPSEDRPIDIFITEDGAVFLADKAVTADALAANLAALPAETRSQRIRLRADRAVDYERVMAVFEALTAQGFARIGLVAAPAPGVVTP